MVEAAVVVVCLVVFWKFCLDFRWYRCLCFESVVGGSLLKSFVRWRVDKITAAFATLCCTIPYVFSIYILGALQYGRV